MSLDRAYNLNLLSHGLVMGVDMKHCKGCGQDKPATLEFFYSNKGNKDGLSYKCKECKDAQGRLYRKNNKEKVAAQKRAYFERTREKTRDYMYRRNYGIGLEEVNEILEKQNHQCAICGHSEPHERFVAATLVVDHCHENNKVRGLLCRDCNMGLGHFKDDSELLQKAANYLNG